MSLVFAAIVPHSPLLIPSIGREHSERLKKTADALETLAKDLEAAAPETIVIISPHGPVADEHFTLDIDKDYVCNLKEFGVFEPVMACRPDLKTISGLREAAEDLGLPIMLRSEAALDYGALVPLYRLAARLPATSIVPVYPCLLPLKTHFEFGRALQEVVMHSNRRIAVIASAELSHRLTENAPGGFSPSAAAFDEKVIQLVSNRNSSGLLNIDPELAREAGECGLHALAMFAGVLDRIEAAPEVLSYEWPFGIGELTVRYRMA